MNIGTGTELSVCEKNLLPLHSHFWSYLKKKNSATNFSAAKIFVGPLFEFCDRKFGPLATLVQVPVYVFCILKYYAYFRVT
jgi:hypothetical protein